VAGCLLSSSARGLLYCLDEGWVCYGGRGLLLAMATIMVGSIVIGIAMQHAIGFST